jgi:ribosomal protein L16 Arg81 hydroxylase
MSRPKTLPRIIAPLSVEAFATNYFQHRPLFLRGHSRKFTFLFKQDDFTQELDRTTEIRAVFSDLWQAQIQAADIKEMIHAGASICVTGMEKAHPKLDRAARDIKAELGFGGTVSFRAYMSPPGSGFDLHFDARVATTLQVAGTKRWWFSLEPAIPFPTANSGRPLSAFSSQYKIPKTADLKSVLLRPGDLLCLPAGVWHRAKAKTTSLALNLAFDHSGAGMLEFIVGLLERRLEKQVDWRMPLPVAPKTRRKAGGDAVVELVRRRIDAIQRELDSIREDEREIRRSWLSERAPQGPQ